MYILRLPLLAVAMLLVLLSALPANVLASDPHAADSAAIDALPARRVLLPVNDFPPDYIIPNLPGHRITGRAVTAIAAVLARYNERHALADGERLALKTTGQLPFARCLAMMEAGHAEIIGALFRNPEREAYMHLFTYQTDSNIRFVLRHGQDDIRSYEDLAGLSIGVQHGYRYFPRFDNDETLNRVTAYSTLELLEKLRRKIVDVALFQDKLYAMLMAQNPEYERSTALASYAYSTPQPVNIGISKKSFLGREPYLSRLGQIIIEMRESGELERLMGEFLARVKPVDN